MLTLREAMQTSAGNRRIAEVRRDLEQRARVAGKQAAAAQAAVDELREAIAEALN